MKKIFTLAGILLIVAGLLGLGITYRALKLQRHLHDKLAGARIVLSQSGAEDEEHFTAPGPGLYTVHLATLTPVRQARRGGVAFGGMVEYSIADTAGRIRYLSRILPGSMAALVPDTATLLILDTIYIPEAGAPMQLRARVMAPDSNFAHTRSELFLMPPGDPGFDGYVRSQSAWMAAMGLTMVAGFCIMVLGGRARRTP
jgi:hypothetical protein